MELLPCPRCGNQAFVTIHFGVWCEADRCLKLPDRDNRDEAIAAWNHRTPVHESAVPTGICPEDVS